MSENPDNSAIQAMRTQIKTLETAIAEKSNNEAALQTQLAEAQSKLTQFEQAQLTETERLKAQAVEAAQKAQELEPYKAQAEALTASFQAMLDARIQAIPEDRRDTIVGILNKNASPAEQLEQLDKLEKLVTPPAVENETKPGAIVPPPATPPATTPAPTGTIDPRALPPWGEVLKT